MQNTALKEEKSTNKNNYLFDSQEESEMATPAYTSGFKARLLKARLEAGYRTAKDFASALSITPERYRKYERDDWENILPGMEALILISDASGKSLDWLIRGKGSS